ncbi:DUF1588 domain-containing protein [Paraliomyxa miuraensis]|uniref:DUF1588 domain-containing protein n=1 Tax=Paraliomyxa miuraensis TaxID=376150 RepID=UPI002259E22C|nr:DUF1588 domain-containing protein [Paraliomyxa miuraensis]MCX4246132.1 DUF1588 domain-containing protein [Paraliomyxa miuraensis]
MMYARKNKKTLGLATMAAGLGLLAIPGCGNDDANGDCVSNETFFRENVSRFLVGTSQESGCVGCHNPTGAAKDTSFILRTSEWGPDYVEQNLEVFTQMSRLEYDGVPWVIAKPTARVDHGGAKQFDDDSEQYAVFTEMISRLDNPVVCDEGDPAEQFFDGVELLDEVATLRKASLALVGRLPTIEEEQQVRDGGFEALDVVLDQMMTDEVFYDRIVEIYNDHFLTDRYYPGTNAIDLLAGLTDNNDNPIYPNLFWYDDGSAEAGAPSEEFLRNEEFTNKGISRQSLELVAHVVRNDLPFTEILTADYTMVNPFSAKAFGVNPAFNNPDDYNEFQPAKLPGVPHAGVLTNPIFMNRFPTTPTNRNRHRARMVYQFFLATDVLRLGERPLNDIAELPDNPTMNAQECSLCHEALDPMSGLMQNWDEMGRYNPPETWYTDMRQAGFGSETLPVGEKPRAEQWLAQQLVADGRFAIAPIHILFKGLSGQDPLREPSDVQDEHYLQAIRAYDVQTQVFQGIADKFVEDNYNLKSVIKEIIKSPYYRAYNAADSLSPEREAELAEVGTGRLLTPEQLHRKIEAITGQPWRNGGTNYLLSENEYLIFYGGIDSDDVTTRITEPNGIMANVAARMANEMACWTVAADFAKDPAERMMFPFVEVGFEPEDENGFEVAGAASAIRANIQYLHQRLLGEFVDLNDPEIDRTYQLYLDVWKDGQEKLTLPPEEGGYGGGLPGQCQATVDYWTGEPLPDGRQITSDETYTIRAWMAVTAYLLTDYSFLHE